MATSELTEETVLNILRQVIDPELGYNIVDLGFVYSVEIHGNKVAVKMTLTTPGCPMSQSLTEAARHALLNLEGVEEVSVEMVWDPPWTRDMISPELRAKLGIG